MPCNSDYLNPTSRERELSRVATFWDEVNGKRVQKSWLEGYHPAVYNKSVSKEQADEMVAVLCNRLKRVKVTDYSLELQIWWRDHKAADRERIAREKRTK